MVVVTGRAGLLLALALLTGTAVAGCVTPLRQPEVGEVPIAVGLTETDPPVLVHNYDQRSVQSDLARTDPRRGWGLMLVARLRYLPEPGCFGLEYGDGQYGPVAAWPLGTQPLHRDGAIAGLEVPGYGELALDAEFEARSWDVSRRDGWSGLPDGCDLTEPDPGGSGDYRLVFLPRGPE